MAARKNSTRLGLMTLAVFCLGDAAISFAEQPIEQIERTVARVTEVLREAGAHAGKGESRQTIRRILLPRFDFAEMARRSLGSHWNRHEERQQEFVSVFADFIQQSYMSTLESYKGEKIVYLRERIERNLAEVETRIVPAQGEPFLVNYRLHMVQGDWKIYDVVVDHIGLVSNFRSQFNRILATASFDDLLKALREKGSERRT